MTLFLRYVKSKSKIIILLFVCAVVFFVSFLLYQLPISAVIYPFLLCLVFLGIYTAFDYHKTKIKHEKLTKLAKLKDTFSQSDIDTESIGEEDFSEIVKVLNEEISRIKAEDFAKYRDMTDYYTVWVHQIKTPISSMKLVLQDEDSELSRKVSSDLFRIQQYVDMVLAYIRLSSVSSDYVFKEYALDDIIKPCVRKFASEFILRKLTLCYEPVNCSIITDEKWFSFVIEQILSNALKYTKSGTITISVEDNKLCIADTGIGINDEDIPRVFEKGFTGYNGRDDKSASGLGLYLCKKICDNLSLDISIESEISVGTKVFIDLTQKKGKFE